MKYYYQHKRHGGVMELNQKMEDENWKEITEEQYEREYSRNWKLAMSFWDRLNLSPFVFSRALAH